MRYCSKSGFKQAKFSAGALWAPASVGPLVISFHRAQNSWRRSCLQYWCGTTLMLGRRHCPVVEPLTIQMALWFKVLSLKLCQEQTDSHYRRQFTHSKHLLASLYYQQSKIVCIFVFVFIFISWGGLLYK